MATGSDVCGKNKEIGNNKQVVLSETQTFAEASHIFLGQTN